MLGWSLLLVFPIGKLLDLTLLLSPLHSHITR